MTWLLSLLVLWVVVAVIGALVLGRAIRIAEERPAIDGRPPIENRPSPADLPDVAPPGQAVVPWPRAAADGEWHTARGRRGHRTHRSGAA